MRKIFLATCALCLALSGAKAQDLSESDPNSTPKQATSNDSGYQNVRGNDITFDYSSESKTGSFGLTMDSGNYSYAV